MSRPGWTGTVVTELPMRPTLSHLDESEALQDADDLSRLQHREAGHVRRRVWCAYR